MDTAAAAAATCGGPVAGDLYLTNLFRNRYGFYSENVQAVGWAIFGALQGMGDSVD